MRNLFPIGVAAHSIFLIQLGPLIGLMLYKLILGQSQRLCVIGLSGKIGLGILDCLFEVLKGLFVGVDEHLVIQLEGKFFS